MLRKNNIRKQHRVHRLILEAFIGPRPPGFYACHIDDNRTNNKLSNLKWGSPKENGQDAKRNNRMPSGTKVKGALSDSLIENIFKLSADGYSAYAISKILKINKRSVLLNLDGKTTRGKILLEKYKKNYIPIKTLTKKCSRKADNNPSAKLNWETVREIRAFYKTGDYSQHSLANKYKMCKNTIGKIVRNETWLETEKIAC